MASKHFLNSVQGLEPSIYAKNAKIKILKLLTCGYRTQASGLGSELVNHYTTDPVAHKLYCVAEKKDFVTNMNIFMPIEYHV